MLPLENLKIIEVSCKRDLDGRVDKLVKFVDTPHTTAQAGLPASVLEDALVSESDMILQRRRRHYGAKSSEHFLIKWCSRPPAWMVTVIWESDPGPSSL